jgi:SIS domain
MTPLDTSASGTSQPSRLDPWREKVMHKCRESVEVKEKFFEHYADATGELSQKMAERFREGHQLWVMGNGGSACDAQHVAVEFIHPIIEKRRPLPALDLVSQIPGRVGLYARFQVEDEESYAEKVCWP